MVGHSPPVNPPPGALTTYVDVSIPVQPGDVIGLYTGSTSARVHMSTPPTAGYIFTDTLADVPPGSTVTYDGPYDNAVLDVSATLEADCDSDGLGDETEDQLLAGGTCPTLLREIAIDAGKKTVAKGKKVRLSGRVFAEGDAAACEVDQVVTIERKLTGKKFKPAKSATSGDGGDYAAKIKVKKPATFRSRLNATSACAGAVSNREKVGLKK